MWPSSDENAVLESELTPVTYREAETSNDRLWEGPWNFRELPYGADYFLENVVDPAHVGVSHHNIVGDRYKSQELVLDTVTPVTKDGFSISSKSPNTENPGITTFHAPSLVAIDAPAANGAKQTLELYCSPSRPGFCNHVGRMVILKDNDGKMPNLLRQFTFPMPKWLNHVAASAFLNQDALFLHHQERHMATTGQYKGYMDDGEEPYHYTKAVYPVNTDKGVINLRNWMRQLAGGGIPYQNSPTMPESSNEVVFDVWNGHTKYCKYCQDALRRLKKVRFASYFAAACMAVVRPAKLGVKGSLASTLALAGIGLLVNKLIGMFYRYEFSHSHND